MDRGAWWAAVHGVAKSRTWLKDFTSTFPFHALEKEMATHSSVLAWRILETGEPGGLPSLGSHRVGHDWRDLASAAVASTSLLFKIGTIATNTFLPVRNKFIYFYSTKICASGFEAFSVSCWLWKHFFCKKLLRCLEVVVGWWEVRWIWWMRQNL